MPDFAGRNIIKIQPGTTNYPLSFVFSSCTAANANDGALPYGDSIVSATVTARDQAGEDITSDLVTGAVSADNNVVSCRVSWYASMPSGAYKLTISFTCASGYADEVDFKRIFAIDT